MPELPDVVVYMERLEPLVLGRRVERVRVLNPFVLRTVEPSLHVVRGEDALREFDLGGLEVLDSSVFTLR